MSKISSGYLLTPHKKMGSKRAKENANQEFDKEAFQELLNCPEKKKIVLQLLSDNKHIIAKHRETEMNSPVEKLKQKRKRLESPTTLYRRRALQQMDSSSISNKTNSSKLDSASSSTSTETAPLNQVLKGVITARKSKIVDKTESSTSMSSLRLSTAKSATSMSSLKLSLESKKSSFNLSSEMPELKLSSENISDDSEIISLVKQPLTRDLFVRIEKLPNVDEERKKMGRKLYNPDDYIPPSWQWVDDDKEREERRQAAKRKKANVTGSNPLVWLLAFNRSRDEEESQKELEIDLKNDSLPKKTKTPKKPVLNESADEQRDLLKEVLKTQKGKTTATPTRRKSLRIEAQTPVNRRSTLEFVSTLSKKKSKKKVNKLPTIVCTKLHSADVELFAQVVKKLGRFVVEDEVSERTTHLVAGEPKRTINMLRAISRGCWVVKFEWVLQSLESGKWLPEENFELTDFSSAVQKSRLERQAFGSNYTLDVFETTPPIYVAPSTNSRCSDLKELITTCKGKVVSAARKAKIVVGQYVKQDETKCVNETWILDCITFYRQMPFKKKYLLQAI